MQLTFFTDYALRSLMFLAAHPQKTSSVKEIAEHYGISRNHLVKVVHKLATLGLIETSKGKGGGVRLALDPASIRLGDIIRQIESLEIVECFNSQTNTCRISEVCRLRHYLHEASQSFIQVLNKYTLADAAGSLSAFTEPLAKPPPAKLRTRRAR